MFKGIFAALFTPFDENDELSEPLLREHVDFLARKGADGVYITGNSGQGLFMSVAERVRLAEIVQDQTAGRLQIIFHVAALATRDAKELVRHANRLGLDGIASLPPVYWQYSPKEILDYYRAINADSELPCLVYHKPGGGVQELTQETMLEIADVPNVVGLKYTSPDFFWLQDLLNKLEGRWIALSGPDQLFLPALTMGVSGCIGTTQNILPELFRGIYDDFNAGRLADAAAKQARVTPVVSVYRRFGGIPTAKAFLRWRGIDPGLCRPPLTPRLPAEQENVVRAAADAHIPEFRGDV